VEKRQRTLEPMPEENPKLNRREAPLNPIGRTRNRYQLGPQL
jgi:hypothetical protein